MFFRNKTIERLNKELRDANRRWEKELETSRALFDRNLELEKSCAELKVENYKLKQQIVELKKEPVKLVLNLDGKVLSEGFARRGNAT